MNLYPLSGHRAKDLLFVSTRQDSEGAVNSAEARFHRDNGPTERSAVVSKQFILYIWIADEPATLLEAVQTAWLWQIII